jgi:hypothetical protein
MSTALDLQNERCQRFGSLSAECFAPFGLLLVVVGLIFFVTTVALAILAFSGPKSSSD